MANNDQETLNNLVATIEAVAAGNPLHGDDVDTQVVTAEMLEGAVLHLSDGQSINVVQMSGSLEDGINVVQVETTELGDVSSVEEICAIDVDIEEQQHILSETGAHVIVQTEDERIPTISDPRSLKQPSQRKNVPPELRPTVPFSFPGQTFDAKCQKLILNVWDFFKRVKRNPDLLDEIRTPQELAAAALHISAATIGKIGKKFNKTGRLVTPGKKRNRPKPVVDSVDAEQEQVIRDIIHELRENRVTPTLHLVLNECRERINYLGGATSFRRILQRMGFRGLSRMAHNTNMRTMKTAPSPSSTTNSPSKSIQSKASPKPNRSSSIQSKLENSYVSIPIKSSPAMKKNSLKPESFSPSKDKDSGASIIMSPNKQDALIDLDKYSSKLVNNLFGGGSVLQLGTGTTNRETFTITPQALSALISAGPKSKDSQPQTIHLLGADNTLQQIQIVYANAIE